MILMGEPALISPDEPTTGLDPRSRQRLWQIVRELVAEGVTVFLTTQYLAGADELADQIALLDHGRIVAAGTPAELKRESASATFSDRQRPENLNCFDDVVGMHPCCAVRVKGGQEDAGRCRPCTVHFYGAIDRGSTEDEG